MNKVTYIIMCAILGLTQCSTPSIPKPEGYFRITMPEVDYKPDTTHCGLEIEKPVYSILENVENEKGGNSCWFNLSFPDYNARFHCTEVEIQENLASLMNDSEESVFNHEAKANGISRIRVNNKEAGIYGVLYHLGGPVATPIQFFVTDSTKHFLRGSLYFNTSVNVDSTSPVVRRLLFDTEHLMRTVKWK